MKLEIQIINKNGVIADKMEYDDIYTAVKDLKKLTKSKVMGLCGYNKKQGFTPDDTIEVYLRVTEDLYGETIKQLLLIAGRSFQIVEGGE